MTNVITPTKLNITSITFTTLNSSDLMVAPTEPTVQTDNTNQMKTLLEANGWIDETLGCFRSNGQIKEKTGFLLYTRRRNLNRFIDDYNQKSSSIECPKPCKNKVSARGSSSPMGSPEPNLTPSVYDGVVSSGSHPGSENTLPALSSFSDYPSLMSARKDKPCLLIGYDSEWENLDYGREMLSWQYALVDGSDLVEYVFLKKGDRDLSLEEAIGYILDHIGKYKPVDIRDVRRYQYCVGWTDNKPDVVEVPTDKLNEARSNCRYVYRPDIGFTHELIQDMPDRFVKRADRDWAWFHTYNDFSSVENIKICIICHAGKVDLSALTYGKKNLLRYLTEVQGGLTSLQPVKYTPRSFLHANNTFVYPVSLSISDTMCHAPTGKKKLKDLGEALGIEKVDIDSSLKAHMKNLLADDPCLYMEYASTDSVVTLLYASALYGYNNSLPVTITSATASVMKESMMKYLECESTEEFNRIYRGLEQIKHGNQKIPDRPGFVEATSLEPISNEANSVQYYASQAYHGGYNICSEVGYFPFTTYDYDLQNAYPTAMCLVPDINWEEPIRNEIIRKDMTLEHFAGIGGVNPIVPFVGYVRFQFPDNVKFPCIPINVDGIPEYPLTSNGLDGVYVAGPYVWLALRLGAHVECIRGYFLNTRYVNDYSQESRSLASAVKQLVVDRNHAKRDKGKGSLEELILKVMVNSGYGKNAQNVVQKSSWTAYKDLMEDLGCSAITNPVSAMMITSIVQTELIAAQNQIHELGYMSCSVTTDGFISDCPENVLKRLDLYGLRKFMEASRLFLTDGKDPEIWEIKHAQDDLLNFTTRGNVSLHWFRNDNGVIVGNPMYVGDKPFNGVCAHNSTKSGYESDSYEDRLWLMTQVLCRTGTVDYSENEWSSFKDLVQGKPFVVKPVTRHIRMDFDMKRKPVRSSFSTDIVVIEGVEYKIAHFDTEPFRNVDEFRLYRNKKKLTDVLRTKSDWDLFWLKIDLRATGAQPRDMEWSILNSCIMGYRSGRWDIPYLSQKIETIDDKGNVSIKEAHSVEEKCAWINSHNTSGRVFKPPDWKNARRPERQVNMLPYELIENKLKELINDVS